MNKALMAILVFAALLMFVTSPFAALASLMIFLLIAGFIWTLWTLVQAFISGDPKRDWQ